MVLTCSAVVVLTVAVCSAVTRPGGATLPSYEFAAVASAFTCNATTVCANEFGGLSGASNRIALIRCRRVVSAAWGTVRHSELASWVSAWF